MDTERQGEDGDEYRPDPNAYAESTMHQDTQNPLDQFYEQYGARLGIR